MTAVKLSLKEKIGYSLGDTASHFVWDMVGFWLLFFYTDVYGISAAAAGTIMLVARFWDMAIDPVIGIVSDRTNTRWGKFRPYILFGAIPYSILAILTFSTPNFGEAGKIAYAGATYVLLMTAYAAINLPYSALGAVMTDDTYERAGLNTYRFIAGFTGQFVVTGLALTLAEFFGHGDKAKGFQNTVFLFAGLSLIFFFITFKTTRERVQPPKQQVNSLKDLMINDTNKRELLLRIGNLESSFNANKALFDTTGNVMGLIQQLYAMYNNILNNNTSISVNYNFDPMVLNSLVILNQQYNWKSDTAANMGDIIAVPGPKTLSLAKYTNYFKHQLYSGGLPVDISLTDYADVRIDDTLFPWQNGQSFDIAFDTRIDVGSFGIRVYTDAANRTNSGTYGVRVVMLDGTYFNAANDNRPLIRITCTDKVALQFTIDKIR